MTYQDILVSILDINGWSFLPNYPFGEALYDLEGNKEIEQYCEKVLKDLPSLIAENN